MVIIGIDAHTRVHVAAAIDEHGRILALTESGAGPEELDRLVGWVCGFRRRSARSSGRSKRLRARSDPTAPRRWRICGRHCYAPHGRRPSIESPAGQG
jgi:hypothetical protein